MRTHPARHATTPSDARRKRHGRDPPCPACARHKPTARPESNPQRSSGKNVPTGFRPLPGICPGAIERACLVYLPFPECRWFAKLVQTRHPPSGKSRQTVQDSKHPTGVSVGEPGHRPFRFGFQPIRLSSRATIIRVSRTPGANPPSVCTASSTLPSRMNSSGTEPE